MNLKKENKKLIIDTFALFLAFSSLSSFAIEESTQSNETKKTKFSWFKKKDSQSDKKTKKNNKKVRVEEIKLPNVVEGKPNIPFNQLSVMTIDDCVDYALLHNPNLSVSNERIKRCNI